MLPVASPGAHSNSASQRPQHRSHPFFAALRKQQHGAAWGGARASQEAQDWHPESDP